LTFWRFRAEEVRSIADDMKVIETKAIMSRIAADYEHIAKLVEQLRDEGHLVSATRGQRYLRLLR
jgi:hypothetical protein